MTGPNVPLDAPRSGPLNGIVVADLSRVMAGPYAAMMLGDMGATVIKVEHPSGDETRGFAPPLRDDVATYYLSANRNKYGMALDFSVEEDRQTAVDIIDRSDIVIQNFKVGGLRQFGLDYETLSAERPGLIYASISGFGRGAGAHLPGYDLCAQAVSGLMSIQGDPDGDPYRAGFALFDVFAGMHTVMGVLGALRHRDLTGHGQEIEVDLLSSGLASMANQTMAYIGAGVVPHRMGNEHPSLYPYAPFPTADRELIIAVGNDRQFRTLCAVLDIPAIADDARFLTGPTRNQHRDALRQILEPRLVTAGADHWFDLLSARGVPCSPINTIGQGVDYATRLGLDPIQYAGAEQEPTVRHPVTYSATPAGYELAPPTIGQHNDAVRAWITQTTTKKGN
ncbi:CoA transferase [Salinibacterium sp. ZJ454]|uniref:CaiB/BaiF CoA transferase family protein n=1 Tax=Salinibacterium sp. ZJ454 TaxID=2708339 RepID=UPI001FBB426E|nr:CoA transferase [Salinibacterium sp. ZJ454]